MIEHPNVKNVHYRIVDLNGFIIQINIVLRQIKVICTFETSINE